MGVLIRCLFCLGIRQFGGMLLKAGSTSNVQQDLWLCLRAMGPWGGMDEALPASSLGRGPGLSFFSF